MSEKSELLEFILDQLTGAFCDSDEIEGISFLRDKAAESSFDRIQVLSGLDMLISSRDDELLSLLPDLGERVNAEFESCIRAREWLVNVRKGVDLGDDAFEATRAKTAASSLLGTLRHFLKDPNDKAGIAELKRDISKHGEMRGDFEFGLNFLLGQNAGQLERNLASETGFLFSSEKDAREWLLRLKSEFGLEL